MTDIIDLSNAACGCQFHRFFPGSEAPCRLPATARDATAPCHHGIVGDCVQCDDENQPVPDAVLGWAVQP